MKEIDIYTDGSCLGNPGPGGWGVVLIYQGRQHELNGGEQNTTNNRMELTAAINGLEALKESCVVNIYTDSKYVKQGISEWIKNWRKNNWRNSRKEPVKNVDLWQKLDQIVSEHQVSWHWVKAHAGNELNERADKLALGAAQQVSKEQKL